MKINDDFLETMGALTGVVIGIPLVLGVWGALIGFTWRVARWAFGGGW